MKSDVKTSFVSLNGQFVSASRYAMETLNLKPGQRITQDQFWAIVAANAEDLCNYVEDQAAQGLSTVDTSALREQINHYKDTVQKGKSHA